MLEGAGIGGFEPPHDDIKNRCLTAWPYPNILYKYYKINCTNIQAFNTCFIKYMYVMLTVL